ncbi:peptidase S8 [Seongchinamella sediminis]|uniref:Peptidase S8 n=2 Tax=Seongchinamella sediminis TaxID=2283635 RepID=A0A3L7DY22_9GAMM|nr:peptidase S8 [Seongchinamella sediminis]
MLVALGLAIASGGLQAAPDSDNPWREGRILVKPKAGLSDAEFDRILKRQGGRAIGRLRKLGIKVVKVPPQAEDAVAKALARNRHIKFAEKDMLVEASEFIPNDPKYAEAWHLPTLKAPLAWEMTTAHGITIAILDTGVNSAHPDLVGQVVAGWNSVSRNADTEDVNGHGTKVAGTAAATTDNGIGVAAIGLGANIMPIRITNRSDGYAYWSDIANGLTWAADKGADVANISYSVTDSSSVTSAAQYMRKKMGLVVAAAGNDGSDPGWGDNPAIISVSATTSGDAKASWSNYGSYIDVAAPGVGIRTTTSSGSYGSVSGTSFASPATAGVIALIMGANPGLSPDEIESILEASADDLVDGSDWHAYYGHGRVNAAAAVEMALGTDQTSMDYEAPQVTIFSPSTGSTVNGMITVDVNAVDNVGVTEVALYVAGELVGTDSTAPYQFSWDSTQSWDGEVAFSAVAYDAAGNEGVSANVVVEVDNVADVTDTTPPAVDISNPADGSTVSRTVAIRVQGWDDVNVATVRLYINGQLKSSASSATLDYSWNTRKEADGAHTIVAEATDTSGNAATRSIQVNKGSGNDTGSDTGNDSGNKGNGKKKK